MRSERRFDVGLLLLCAVIFLTPMLIEALTTNSYPGGIDTRNAFMPWMLYTRQEIFAGRIPLWNPHHFMGEPFLANPQVAFFSPITWLGVLLPIQVGLWLQMVACVWVAACGMLFYIHEMTRDNPQATPATRRVGALVAALAFGFGGYMAARLFAGHLTLMAAAALGPWLAWAAVWGLRQPGGILRYAVPGGLLALSLFAGHPTTLFYTGLIWVLHVMYITLLRRDLADGLRFALLAGLLSVAFGAVQLLPTFELIPQTWRSPQIIFEDGSFLWSLTFEEFSHLIAPGPIEHEMGLFVGAFTFGMALLGLIRWRQYVPALLAVAVFGLMLAMGSNFFLYPWLYEYLPGFDAVRVPGRATLLVVFSLSAAAGLTAATVQPPVWLQWGWVPPIVIGAVAVAGRLSDAPFLAGDAGQYLIASGFLLAVLLAWGFSQGRHKQLGAVLVAVTLFAELGSYGMGVANNVFRPPDFTAILGEEYSDVERLAVPSRRPLRNWPAVQNITVTLAYNPLLLEHYYNYLTPQTCDDPIYEVLAVDAVLTSEGNVNRCDDSPIAQLSYDAALVGAGQACPTGQGEGQATIVSHKPHRWLIEVESSAPAVLVLAEADYSRWQVRINGERADPVRVHTALRGVCVPAGTTTVEWVYTPGWLVGGGVLSVGSLGLSIGMFMWERRRS
jgi:hypothetical protein